MLTTFPGRDVEVSPRRLVHDEISTVGLGYAAQREVVEADRLARVIELHARLRAGTLLGRGALTP